MKNLEEKIRKFIREFENLLLDIKIEVQELKRKPFSVYSIENDYLDGKLVACDVVRNKFNELVYKYFENNLKDDNYDYGEFDFGDETNGYKEIVMWEYEND